MSTRSPRSRLWLLLPSSLALLTVLAGCEDDPAVGDRGSGADGGGGAAGGAGGSGGTGGSGGPVGLGQPCALDAGCFSGICEPDPAGDRVCSECRAGGNDCNASATCAWDPSGGYHGCTGLAELGDACTGDAECSSGHCFLFDAGVGACSLCSDGSDCANGAECTAAGSPFAQCVNLAPLGDPCEIREQCLSQHCNAGVCSACDSDADCGAGVCADARADLGYFACLGPPGERCAADSDCGSGHCAGDPRVCSECGIVEDCPDPTHQSCAYAYDAGYARCSGTAALGDACAAGTECASGACNAGLCAGCASDVECALSCADEPGGPGYAVCAGAPGAPCTGDADCELGRCFDAGGGSRVCSLCRDGDCGRRQNCALDAALGYAACQGTGAAGDSCSNPFQCAPSLLCVEARCADCRTDADCASGSCLPPWSAGSNVSYHACVKELGGACTDDVECSSGLCHLVGARGSCSECRYLEDCAAGERCILRPFDDHATCWTPNLDAPCATDEECSSGFCVSNGASGFCSSCASDADCYGGGSCLLSGVGHSCRRGLGELCDDGGDCNSGFCRVASFSCSACAVDADCGPANAACQPGTAGTFECRGTLATGAACASASECQSGHCNAGACSDCSSGGDCASGACAPDAAAGYSKCLLELGAWSCTVGGADCATGFCFDNAAMSSTHCSLCAVDGDCSAGLSCTFQQSQGYAACLGDAPLGAACTADGDCAESAEGLRICNGGVCSECRTAADCFAGFGATCELDAAAGTHVCRGASGDPCTDGSQCRYGYCWTAGTVFERVCSQCETDADCDAGESCDFAGQIGFAACR